MKLKSLIMSGVAAGTIVCAAGSASALQLSNVGAINAGAISNVCVLNSGTATAVYQLATQTTNASNNTNGANGNTFQFAQDITTGNAQQPTVLAVGQTYQLTVTYTGATVTSSGANSATIVGGNTGTVTFISSTANSATYAVNIQSAVGGGAGTATTFRLAPVIVVNGNGPVQVSARLVFSSGLDADTPLASTNIITSANPFGSAVAASTTQTYIPRTGGYTRVSNQLNTNGDFAGSDPVVGRVQLTATGGICKDLSANQVVASDLTNEAITVNGDFSVVNLLATTSNAAASLVQPGIGTVTYTRPTSATVTIPNGQATVFLSLYNTSQTALPPSGYSVTGSAQLTTATGQYYTPGPVNFSGQIQSLSREGFTVILPWVASATQAGSTGATSQVRVSSTSATASGDIFAELINPSTGTPSNSLVKMGTLNALGEVTFTSQDFETKFGANFVRADIRLTISTPAGTPGSVQFGGASSQPGGAYGVVVKRLVVRPSGIAEFLNVGEEGAGAPVTYMNSNPNPNPNPNVVAGQNPF